MEEVVLLGRFRVSFKHSAFICMFERNSKKKLQHSELK